MVCRQGTAEGPAGGFAEVITGRPFACWRTRLTHTPMSEVCWTSTRPQSIAATPPLASGDCTARDALDSKERPKTLGCIVGTSGSRVARHCGTCRPIAHNCSREPGPGPASNGRPSSKNRARRFGIEIEPAIADRRSAATRRTARREQSFSGGVKFSSGTSTAGRAGANNVCSRGLSCLQG